MNDRIDNLFAQYFGERAELAESGAAIHRRVIMACIDMSINNVDYGSTFVIDLNQKVSRDKYYTKVFPMLSAERGKPLNVLNEIDKPVIRHLAALDGATILDMHGNMKEFGVTLNKHSTFMGHGKRHAFAVGTSRYDNIICILASEEDKHVRIFKSGICIADIDSRTKMPSDIKNRVVEILDAPLSKVLVASGIATSILTLNPIPAIITITGSTVIVSYGFDRIKKLF